MSEAMPEAQFIMIHTDTARRLASAFYRLLERHGADHKVLSVAGSLFDTLTVEECVDMAEDWLETGEIMRSAH